MAMAGRRAARLFAALAAALSLEAAEGTIFSKLEAGSKCADFLLSDVKTKEECFSTAANAVGVGALQKLQIEGLFNGCALNTLANRVIWSHSATAETSMTLPTLQYICDGVPTTTSTVKAVTTMAPTTTMGLFSRLEGGSTCSARGVPDILSENVCFDAAVKSTNLADRRTMAIINIGFTGCVYNSAADMVIFGKTDTFSGAENMVLPNFEYLCDGIAAPVVLPTTTTGLDYSRLAKGAKCWDQQLSAVSSRELCFGAAAAAVGLSEKARLEVNGNGFTGCVYNSVADTLMWGETDGVTPETSTALPMWEYVCAGHAAAPLYP